MTEGRREQLIQRLKDGLDPQHLMVVDDSHRHAGHAGAADGRGHFTVVVVSPQFEGLGTLKRHRLVYEAVGDLMSTDIHALSIQALAPDEPIPS
jgi:BolA family transcriptional regulator, general stress-responsive regulator